MLRVYPGIFDQKRTTAFKKLAVFKKYGVLAGGTALALQIKHRKSFDFDVFLPKPISRHFVKKVIEVFGNNLKTRVSTGDVLLIVTPSGFEVHFIYIWYKRLFPVIKTSSIDLASVGDIAADKAFTIGRRGQWRDYVDIFFLLKKETFSLKEIIDLAEKKYPPEFNPRLFLEQLSWFGDINDFTVSFLKEKYSTAEIKNFLLKEVERFRLKG